jgi:hypothetical protein
MWHKPFELLVAQPERTLIQQLSPFGDLESGFPADGKTDSGSQP